MIKFLLIIFYTLSLLTQFPVQAAPKNNETYETIFNNNPSNPNDTNILKN